MSKHPKPPQYHLLASLFTNVMFFSIFGYQIAKSSHFFLNNAYESLALSILAAWFAALSWLCHRPSLTLNRHALFITQGTCLLIAQYCMVFNSNHLVWMSVGSLFSIIGIHIGLLNPWLTHNQHAGYPMTNPIRIITPFVGLLIGQTLAKHTHTGTIALFIWPVILTTIQFNRLACIEKQQSKIPAKHYLHWFNIGWFWLSVVGFLHTISLINPVFYGVGFILSISFTDWKEQKNWETNSIGYWLIIQAGVMLYAHGHPSASQLTSAITMTLFGAASCKILIPSLSRLQHGHITHVQIGSIAWLFFAYAAYPLALTHGYITTTLWIILLIINSFITDTRSNLLASVFGVLQFILHRIGIRYIGTENLNYHPKQRVLMVSNHSCFLDVPIIASRFDETLTYPIYPFWLDVWVIRVIGGMLASMHPMKPGQSSSLANVIHAIRMGGKCLIFPEGRLTDTGNLMKIFEGTVILAEHAKATHYHQRWHESYQQS